MAEDRFRCTPAGAVEQSRLKLRRLLLGLASGMLLLGVVMLFLQRLGAGLISLATAFMCWFSWQMSGDMDPLWLEFEEGGLEVQMRRRRDRLPLEDAQARLLLPDEIDHLRDLASASGVIFATAGFESGRFGEVELFTTDLSHSVLIDVRDEESEDGRRRWVVTPDDSAAFLGRLESETG